MTDGPVEPAALLPIPTSQAAQDLLASPTSQGPSAAPASPAQRPCSEWPLLPVCVLNTLLNPVHFAFDGEAAFWGFPSRDADLMDCDFSLGLLFGRGKKGSIKKATQFLFAQGKKKICLLFRP